MPAKEVGAADVAPGFDVGRFHVDGPCDPAEGPGQFHDRPERGESAGHRRRREPPALKMDLVAEGNGVGLAG